MEKIARGREDNEKDGASKGEQHGFARRRRTREAQERRRPCSRKKERGVLLLVVLLLSKFANVFKNRFLKIGA